MYDTIQFLIKYPDALAEAYYILLGFFIPFNMNIYILSEYLVVITEYFYFFNEPEPLIKGLLLLMI